MTTAIKRRRGTTAQHATFTGLEGELTVDTTKDTVVVHDGATAGGFPLAKESQATTNVAITGGTISGITDLAVADGGTGASTAGDARTNLGVTATGADTTYAYRANNLSDLASASTARTNLGLGTAATTASTDYATAAQGTKADNALTAANPSYTGTLTGGTGIVNLGSGQFYKDASGNVGIGTNNPICKLDVVGSNSRIRWDLSQTYTYQGSTNPAGNAFANTVYDGLTHQWMTSSVERMRIDSSGNVGIGTASPASQLDVSKTGDATISLTSAGVQRYQLIARSGGRFDFYDQSAAANRWSVDQSGNLLVGTTSNPFSAISTGKITTLMSSGQTGYLLDGYGDAIGYGIAVRQSASASGGNGWAMIMFNSSNTQVGGIRTTTTSTAYNTSSDYRLKENIAPMTGALSIVSKLKPVTYTWKSNGKDSQGFIAHELQEIVPDCVTGEKDAVDADGNPVYQGIDTSFLVATLTAAIQELKAELDATKAEVAALKAAA